MLFLLQITWYGHVTHAYSSARYPLQKLWFKNSSGVIWGHRGQKVIFTKNAISATDYMLWSCDSMHIHQLDTLYKSYGRKNSSEVIWGHRGQKVIFTKNAITSPQITWYGHVTHAY